MSFQRWINGTVFVTKTSQAVPEICCPHRHHVILHLVGIRAAAGIRRNLGATLVFRGFPFRKQQVIIEHKALAAQKLRRTSAAGLWRGVDLGRRMALAPGGSGCCNMPGLKRMDATSQGVTARARRTQCCRSGVRFE